MVLLNPAPNVVGGKNMYEEGTKVVLTFDEKVKVAEGAVATLAGKTLTPVVSGKTVSFDYKNTSITNITPPATWDNGFGKFIRNNQILIVRDGKTYTVTGVQK